MIADLALSQENIAQPELSIMGSQELQPHISAMPLLHSGELRKASEP